MPPRITVVGCLGGAGLGAVTGPAAVALLTSVVFGVFAGVAVALFFVSTGAACLFLPPNIGDHAKPRRGAKLELLSMLFWFSYLSPGENVRCWRGFQSS